MKRKSRLLNLLEVLRRFEDTEASFSLDDLTSETDYAVSSIRSYYAKKLKGYLIHPEPDGSLSARGTHLISDEQFLEHMTQKSERVADSPEQAMLAGLRRRSRDSFLLALELYNRPLLENRVEAFCILACNAWELLLKSEILDVDGMDSLFYREEPNKSVSFRNALARRFPNERDPIRKNLERIGDLRDLAVHLLIPDLQPNLSGLFQATVLNYVERYRDNTGASPLGDAGAGLISLVVDRAGIGLGQVKEKYGDETYRNVRAFLERFQKDLDEMKDQRFAVSIEYKVALVKNPSEGDVVLAQGKGGVPGVPVRIPRDPDDTHPYRPTDVVHAVRKRLPNGVAQEFSMHALQGILLKHHIRKVKLNKYYYRLEKPETHRFSDEFVDFVINLWKQDASCFIKAKESFSADVRKRRENSKK